MEGIMCVKTSQENKIRAENVGMQRHADMVGVGGMYMFEGCNECICLRGVMNV